MISLIQITWRKLKKWTSPSFLSKVLELNRISSLPRFTVGETKLLGKALQFSDASSFIQSYHEIFEQNVYAFKSNTAIPVILDCGANIGLSIIYYKTLYPQAKIIGFEPDPKLFQLIKINLKEFGFEDVELHQKAVLDLDTKVSFLSQGGSSGQVIDEKEKLIDARIIEVETVTLNLFITSTIHFLKIDIEGAEYLVLKSIEDKLHHVEKMFIEYHSFPGREQELDLILAVLRKAKFRYYLYPAVIKEIPFQGIGNEDMDMQLNIYAIR